MRKRRAGHPRAGQPQQDSAAREATGLARVSESNSPEDSENLEVNEPTGRSVSEIREVRFKGPLPHPEVLAGYEQILPGAAERIIAMAEREGDHRRELERMLLERDFSEGKRGQIFALITVGFFLLAGVIVAVYADAAWGAGLGSVGVATIVTTFIAGRRRSSKPADPA